MEWRLDELWVYPLPENVGLTLDNDRGDLVARLAADSPAARLGIQTDDRLLTVNGRPIASFADLRRAFVSPPPLPEGCSLDSAGNPRFGP